MNHGGGVELAPEPPLGLRSRGEVRQPEMVAIGDAILLRQALGNLLQNAWKYTSKASAARVSFDSYLEGQSRVYRLQDNGAGFDPDYTNKLFRPFERLQNARPAARGAIG